MPSDIFLKWNYNSNNQSRAINLTAIIEECAKYTEHAWFNEGLRWKGWYPIAYLRPYELFNDSDKRIFWGQLHETKLSVCFASTWEETYAQPKNLYKSFNKISEKFPLSEVFFWIITSKIDHRTISSGLPGIVAEVEPMSTCPIRHLVFTFS